MVQCAALNCTNRSDDGKKTSMFLFPKDRKLRKEWTVKLKREGFSPSSHTRLCRYHFVPECFVKDPRLMASIGYEPKKLCLKPGAIPTIFDYTPPHSSRNTILKENRPDFETPRRKRSRSNVVLKRRRLELLNSINMAEDILPTSAESTSTSSRFPVYRADQCHMDTQTEPD
ncbi:THAP domain-containing protein 1-like [Argopecten irradians]|uniref:THAP domain-containing protein 1-like n=1 Tax=Argopecten irradians TaxID=31199 RepID=UPI00371A2A64